MYGLPSGTSAYCSLTWHIGHRLCEPQLLILSTKFQQLVFLFEATHYLHERGTENPLNLVEESKVCADGATEKYQPWMSGSRSHSRSTPSVGSFLAWSFRSSNWSNKSPPGAPPESPYTIVNSDWDSWRRSRSSGHRRQKKRRISFTKTLRSSTTNCWPLRRFTMPT